MPGKGGGSPGVARWAMIPACGVRTLTRRCTTRDCHAGSVAARSILSPTDPVSFQCCPIVHDAGPTLLHYFVSAVCSNNRILLILRLLCLPLSNQCWAVACFLGFDDVKRWFNVDTMLGLRLRRWPNIVPTLNELEAADADLERHQTNWRVHIAWPSQNHPDTARVTGHPERNPRDPRVGWRAGAGQPQQRSTPTN